MPNCRVCKKNWTALCCPADGTRLYDFPPTTNLPPGDPLGRFQGLMVLREVDARGNVLLVDDQGVFKAFDAAPTPDTLRRIQNGLAGKVLRRPHAGQDASFIAI